MASEGISNMAPNKPEYLSFKVTPRRTWFHATTGHRGGGYALEQKQKYCAAGYGTASEFGYLGKFEEKLESSKSKVKLCFIPYVRVT
jgi:hypothetical protein